MGARDGQRGFTLGEVLGVVGVVGVGLSLAIPTLNDLLVEEHRARSVNQLVTSLHLAHGAAVTRLRPVTLCPSTDGLRCEGEAWDSGWIQFVDLDRDGRPGPDEEILAASGASPGFEIRSSDFPRALTVDPTGRVLADDGVQLGGRFEFCGLSGAGADRVVAVSGAGSPQLVSPEVPGGTPECPDRR